MKPSFSISAHLAAYEPLDFAHLQAIAEAGFPFVEVWAMTPHLDVSDPLSLARLREWMRQLSLKPLSVHAPFYADLSEARAGKWLSLSHPDPALRRDSLKRTKRALQAIADLGASIGVVHPGAPGSRGEEDDFDCLRKSLDDLLPHVEKLGMRIALENIPVPLGRPERLAGFVRELAHSQIGVCLDAGHAYLTEGQQAHRAYQQLAPLSIALHIHDNDGQKDTHLPPGHGNIPWNSLWSALECARFEGPMTFELRRPEGWTCAVTLAALRQIPGLSLASMPPPGDCER